MSSITYNASSSQSFFQPPVSLPREHLAAIQHIINDALALQSRAPRPPPPPYHNHPRTEQLWFKPRMDMFQSYSASGARPLITATFELPGLRKEDVHIEVLENHMIVAGDRRHVPAAPTASSSSPAEDEEMKDDEVTKNVNEPSSIPTRRNDDSLEGYTVREIKRGRFKRVVPLPAGTKLEDVKAAMHDGILTITFPGSIRPVARSIPVA